MSHIHFIGGEKGGVGKSLLARVLAQHFIDRGQDFIGFDTDRSHGALLRFYADYAAPMPLDGHDSLDRVMEAAVEQPDRRVLVDLAAQTQGALTKWLDEAGVAEVAADLGISLHYWHVMDAGRDSVHLLGQWLQSPASRLPLVLVLNEVRGEQFDLLQQSGLLEQAQAQGARVLRLKKLPDTLVQKVDGSGASFWAATQSGGSAALGILDRQRLRVWLQRCSADLDALGV
ncbi:MAG: mobilization protein [Burkholderiales bacterium]|jgi:hypothetical protein